MVSFGYMLNQKVCVSILTTFFKKYNVMVIVEMCHT